MRPSRIKFTVRRLMMAVAAFALLITLGVVSYRLWRTSAYFRAKSDSAASSEKNERATFVRTNAQAEKLRTLLERLSSLSQGPGRDHVAPVPEANIVESTKKLLDSLSRFSLDCQSRAEYFARLRIKYDYHARRPWTVASRDELPPPLVRSPIEKDATPDLEPTSPPNR